MAAKKKPETDYSEVAKNILKAEIKRRGMVYADVAKLVGDDEKVFTNKIARGTFSAAFLFECLDLIGAKNIQIAD